MYSASLHPDGKTFVWGGIDNLLHVCNYESMEQQEEYKGHFGKLKLELAIQYLLYNMYLSLDGLAQSHSLDKYSIVGMHNL